MVSLIAIVGWLGGCASNLDEQQNAPPGAVVSPDNYAGITGSGGVNGTYDRGGALPDQSGRFGASGTMSGGSSGDTNETLRTAQLPRQ